MATQVTDRSTIVQFINELLDNQVPITADDVVDPNAVLSDDDVVPSDTAGLRVALANVVDSTPDSAIPDVFHAAKNAADDSVLDLDGVNDDGTDTNIKGDKMAVKIKENIRTLRRYVSKVIKESLNEVGIMPASSENDDEEDDEVVAGKMRKAKSLKDIARELEASQSDLAKPLAGGDDDYSKDKYGLENQIGVDSADLEADEVEAEEIADKTLQARSMKDIAKDMGMSVSGAKQAVDKAMVKMRFLKDIDDENKLEKLIVIAAGSYIDSLIDSGELNDEDKEALQDYPEEIVELDGFREFLHDIVIDMMKKHPDWKYTGKSGGGWARRGEPQFESLRKSFHKINENMIKEQRARKRK